MLAELLNLKVRYMGNEKSFLTVDALRDINILAIHNITLSRDRQDDQFLTYPIPEFFVEDIVLTRNHTREMCSPKYDMA